MEVREYVSAEIGDQREKLLQRLGIQKRAEMSVAEMIENVSWTNLKKNLLKLGRNDIVQYVQDNTLITEGN